MKLCPNKLLFLLVLSITIFANGEIQHQNHISFQDSSKEKEINLYFALKDSLTLTNLKNAKTHYDNSMSVQLFLEGAFTKNLKFSSSVHVYTDFTNRAILDHLYKPEEGIPYNKQSENKRTWDIFTAQSSYQLKPLKLLAGFDYLEIGPAYRNHVILRGSQNPYRPWMDSSSRIQKPAPTPYFGYNFSLGPIQYTQYAAKLFEKKDSKKYIHIHRLHFNLPKNIELGFSETALYGETTEFSGTNPNPDADSTYRDFEWAYVIPFVPYIFEEHLQGDRDNISLAFDFSIKTIPHWNLYGELLWDDMKSPTSMFDDSWWGNKWATSIGLARENLKFGPTLWNFVAEYTRIEPWVYTHHKGGGYTYASYNQSLGSNLGPNSEELYTEINVDISFLKYTFFTSLVKKGADFGSSIQDIHTPESPTDKTFLKRENRIGYKEIGSKIVINPWEFMAIELGYSRFLGDYKGYKSSFVGSLMW